MEVGFWKKNNSLIRLILRLSIYKDIDIVLYFIKKEKKKIITHIKKKKKRSGNTFN
jgi:hypothetical protein